MSTEIIGIIGGALFLLAFFQVSMGRWNGKSFWYEGCNLLGALLLGWYAIEKHAYTNIVLNLVWGTVALYAITHAVQRHQQRKQTRLSKNKRVARQQSRARA